MNSREQFGRTAAAYTTSVRHATGAEDIVALADPGPDEIALDIATGAGHTAHALAKRCGYVLATDITPEMLAEAGRNAGKLGLANFGLGMALAESLPFADASFDVVTCRIAPHHFQDVPAFCREVRRVLKPPGRAVIHDTVSGEDDTVYEWINDVELRRDPSHVDDMRVSTWPRHLAAAGFELADVIVEMHPDHHEFRDWVKRSATPAEDVAYLEQRYASAPPVVVEALGLAPKGDDSWTWGWPIATFILKPR